MFLVLELLGCQIFAQYSVNQYSDPIFSELFGVKFDTNSNYFDFQNLSSEAITFDEILIAKTTNSNPIIVPPQKTYNGKYFLVGTGIGMSYGDGGIGVKLQLRIGGYQGFGFHIGAGY